MKAFKNKLLVTENLFQIDARMILHSLYPVMEAYSNVSNEEHTGEYFISERHELRHARRELFNIFNALTDMS